MIWQRFPHNLHSVRENHRSLLQSLIYSLVLPKQSVEQTLDWPVVWDALTLMWRLCNVLCIVLLTYPVLGCYTAEDGQTKTTTFKRYCFSSVVMLLTCLVCIRNGKNSLTHWDRVTHICVIKLTNIGSNNGLSPGRRQAIIWNNGGILLIWPLGTNISEMLIG